MHPYLEVVKVVWDAGMTQLGLDTGKAQWEPHSEIHGDPVSEGGGRILIRVIITGYKLLGSTTKSSVAEGGQKSPAGIVFWLALR